MSAVGKAMIRARAILQHGYSVSLADTVDALQDLYSAVLEAEPILPPDPLRSTAHGDSGASQDAFLRERQAHMEMLDRIERITRVARANAR